MLALSEWLGVGRAIWKRFGRAVTYALKACLGTTGTTALSEVGLQAFKQV